MYRIGFDIGQSKIECAVLDPSNTVIFRERKNTSRSTYEEIKDVLHYLYVDAKKTFNGQEHTIGVGFPNMVNDEGIVENCSIFSFEGRPIQLDFEEIFEHPVKIGNDSHCFAIAEATLGAGRKYRRVFGAIIGSGVGGGFVVDGVLQRGNNLLAGEWGHSSLDTSNNIKCRCGRVGCVETWLAGNYIRTWASDAFGQPMPTKDWFEHSVFRHIYYDKFALAVADLVHVLDPDCIILGGGVSNQPYFYTMGVEKLPFYLLTQKPKISIIKAKLGDSAGVIGAALL